MLRWIFTDFIAFYLLIRIINWFYSQYSGFREIYFSFQAFRLSTFMYNVLYSQKLK